MGNASVLWSSAWHIMAAFSVPQGRRRQDDGQFCDTCILQIFARAWKS